MDQQSAKQQIVERVKQASSVLVTVSKHPTVDQVASAIGLGLMLNKIDIHTTTVISGEIPEVMQFLDPSKSVDNNVDGLRDFIITLSKDKADKLRYKVDGDVVKIFITPYKDKISKDDFKFSQGDFNVDVVIALGVAKREDIDESIKAHGRILHDATVVTINAGSNSSDLGSIDWHNPEASCLSEMLVSISEAFGSGLIDDSISTALLTGIVSETDHFRNEHTTPKIMTMSAQLMAAGANQQIIAKNLDGEMSVHIESDSSEQSVDLSSNKSDDKGQQSKSQNEDGTFDAEIIDEEQDKVDDLKEALGEIEQQSDSGAPEQPKKAEGNEKTVSIDHKESPEVVLPNIPPKPDMPAGSLVGGGVKGEFETGGAKSKEAIRKDMSFDEITEPSKPDLSPLDPLDILDKPSPSGPAMQPVGPTPPPRPINQPGFDISKPPEVPLSNNGMNPSLPPLPPQPPAPAPTNFGQPPAFPPQPAGARPVGPQPVAPPSPGINPMPPVAPNVGPPGPAPRPGASPFAPKVQPQQMPEPGNGRRIDPLELAQETTKPLPPEPRIDIDAARRAVEEAANNSGNNVANNPIQSLNAKPLPQASPVPPPVPNVGPNPLASPPLQPATINVPPTNPFPTQHMDIKPSTAPDLPPVAQMPPPSPVPPPPPVPHTGGRISPSAPPTQPGNFGTVQPSAVNNDPLPSGGPAPFNSFDNAAGPPPTTVGTMPPDNRPFPGPPPSL